MMAQTEFRLDPRSACDSLAQPQAESTNPRVEVCLSPDHLHQPSVNGSSFSLAASPRDNPKEAEAFAGRSSLSGSAPPTRTSSGSFGLVADDGLCRPVFMRPYSPSSLSPLAKVSRPPPPPPSHLANGARLWSRSNSESAVALDKVPHCTSNLSPLRSLNRQDTGRGDGKDHTVCISAGQSPGETVNGLKPSVSSSRRALRAVRSGGDSSAASAGSPSPSSPGLSPLREAGRSAAGYQQERPASSPNSHDHEGQSSGYSPKHRRSRPLPSHGTTAAAVALRLNQPMPRSASETAAGEQADYPVGWGRGEDSVAQRLRAAALPPPSPKAGGTGAGGATASAAAGAPMRRGMPSSGGRDGSMPRSFSESAPEERRVSPYSADTISEGNCESIKEAQYLTTAAPHSPAFTSPYNQPGKEARLAVAGPRRQGGRHLRRWSSATSRQLSPPKQSLLALRNAPGSFSEQPLPPNFTANTKLTRAEYRHLVTAHQREKSLQWEGCGANRGHSGPVGGVRWDRQQGAAVGSPAVTASEDRRTPTRAPPQRQRLFRNHSESGCPEGPASAASAAALAPAAIAAGAAVTGVMVGTTAGGRSSGTPPRAPPPSRALFRNHSEKGSLEEVGTEGLVAVTAGRGSSGTPPRPRPRQRTLFRNHSEAGPEATGGRASAVSMKEAVGERRDVTTAGACASVASAAAAAVAARAPDAARTMAGCGTPPRAPPLRILFRNHSESGGTPAPADLLPAAPGRASMAGHAGKVEGAPGSCAPDAVTSLRVSTLLKSRALSTSVGGNFKGQGLKDEAMQSNTPNGVSVEGPFGPSRFHLFPHSTTVTGAEDGGTDGPPTPTTPQAKHTPSLPPLFPRSSTVAGTPDSVTAHGTSLVTAPTGSPQWGLLRRHRAGGRESVLSPVYSRYRTREGPLEGGYPLPYQSPPQRLRSPKGWLKAKLALSSLGSEGTEQPGNGISNEPHGNGLGVGERGLPEAEAAAGALSPMGPSMGSKFLKLPGALLNPEASLAASALPLVSPSSVLLVHSFSVSSAVSSDSPRPQGQTSGVTTLPGGSGNHLLTATLKRMAHGVGNSKPEESSGEETEGEGEGSEGESCGTSSGGRGSGDSEAADVGQGESLLEAQEKTSSPRDDGKQGGRERSLEGTVSGLLDQLGAEEELQGQWSALAKLHALLVTELLAPLSPATAKANGRADTSPSQVGFSTTTLAPGPSAAASAAGTGRTTWSAVAAARGVAEETIEQGGVDALVDVIDSHSDMLRRCQEDITSSSPSSSSAAQTAGSLEWALLECAAACLFLLAVSYSCSASDALVQAGGVPGVVLLLTRGSTACRGYAAGLLVLLAEHRHNHRLLLSSGVLPALLGAVRNETGPVRRDASLAVLLMSASLLFSRQAIEAGLVDTLLTAVRDEEGISGNTTGEGRTIEQRSSGMHGKEETGDPDSADGWRSAFASDILLGKWKREKLICLQRATMLGNSLAVNHCVSLSAMPFAVVASMVLAHLMRFPEGCQAVVGRADGVSYLVDLMDEPLALEVKEQLACVLLSLLQQKHVKARDLVSEGLLPSLVGVAHQVSSEISKAQTLLQEIRKQASTPL